MRLNKHQSLSELFFDVKMLQNFCTGVATEHF